MRHRELAVGLALQGFEVVASDISPAMVGQRTRGSGLEIADRLVQRHGRRGLVVYSWTIPDSWDARHDLQVGVALIDASGKATTVSERLAFWPFTHSELDEDLRRSGFTPESSTYTEKADRYLVTARRSASR